MTDTLTLNDYGLWYDTPSGPVRILDDISLRIAKGEVLGLVGESGSAKSSLANAIIRDLPGKVHAEQGTILLGDQDITAASGAILEKLRGQRIAMVFQNAATTLDPVQTVGNHLIETLERHTTAQGQAATARAVELIEMVGLPDPQAMLTRFPHEISGGEKQRVVLALAFACEPELILFDEPTSALDATTAATLLDLFRDLQARTGVSALFISHDLGTVSDIAHRVAVIYGGRIVEEGAVETVFSDPKHPYTQALMASLPRPSDGRTNRGLAGTAALPAPRRGEIPPCIFSASCPHHDAAICDAQQVRLTDSDDRRTACARVAKGQILHTPAAPNPAPSPRGDDALLQVESLTVSYGSQRLIDSLRNRISPHVRAVNNVSFKVRRGETLALVGESGCGKSSLARALSGLYAHDGVTRLGNEIIPSNSPAWRARVQTIFQNPDSSLNPRHSIGTILGRPLKLIRTDLAPQDRAAEVARLLTRVRLPADYAERYPHQLSGGEKQRVAIARALAARPDVIICDEITSGLDAAVQAAIARLLREIQAESGTALVFITHDLGMLRHIADRVAVMYLGEMVEMGEVASLDTAPWHPYTEALLSSSHSVDPDSETRRVRLTGSLPKRTEDLAGCPFASRCPRHVGAICDSQQPPRRHPAPDHEILCHIDASTLSAVPPIWRFSDQLETQQ
ncbi:peptide/nickel transport system ATP-binding protein [Monaibacterium marinum]|uniref:Peptide/nickel transport system ATP-binding protein n=1 Tax=Pontivivens marinum TaxID=1690039 RepID=A0A2C9CL16_9RHOB|nr:ABC transporter ATP-binding protein [Monaibacterium marinum]SOH92211.1 peptide/nickel transport system ATP-binding protein [Monaibacterium marinum]